MPNATTTLLVPSSNQRPRIFLFACALVPTTGFKWREFTAKQQCWLSCLSPRFSSSLLFSLAIPVTHCIFAIAVLCVYLLLFDSTIQFNLTIISSN